MTALSDYLENKLVDWLFRGQAFSPPSTIYIGLLTASPSDSSAGTEVAVGGYVRVGIASSLANWAGTQGAGTAVASTGASGTTSNNAAITFPSPSASWGVVTHWAAFDAATGGNLLIYGALAQAKTINAGDAAPSFAPGALTFQVDN